MNAKHSAPVLPVVGYMDKDGDFASPNSVEKFEAMAVAYLEPLCKVSDALAAIEANRADALDAARYRWLVNTCGFGIKRNGVTELNVCSAHQATG